MEINFKEYLTEEEMKGIIEQEFKQAVRNEIRNLGVRTFLSNTSYETVFKIVENEIPNFENQIKDKVITIIDEMSSYCVFREKGDFQARNSLGQDYIEQSIKDNKHLIEEKVVKIIETLEENDIAREINNIIEDKINNLFICK